MVSIWYFLEILLTPVKKGKLHVETSLKSKQDNFQSKAWIWELVQKTLIVWVILL